MLPGALVQQSQGEGVDGAAAVDLAGEEVDRCQLNNQRIINGLEVIIQINIRVIIAISMVIRHMEGEPGTIPEMEIPLEIRMGGRCHSNHNNTTIPGYGAEAYLLVEVVIKINHLPSLLEQQQTVRKKQTGKGSGQKF